MMRCAARPHATRDASGCGEQSVIKQTHSVCRLRRSDAKRSTSGACSSAVSSRSRLGLVVRRRPRRRPIGGIGGSRVDHEPLSGAVLLHDEERRSKLVERRLHRRAHAVAGQDGRRIRGAVRGRTRAPPEPDAAGRGARPGEDGPARGTTAGEQGPVLEWGVAKARRTRARAPSAPRCALRSAPPSVEALGVPEKPGCQSRGFRRRCRSAVTQRAAKRRQDGHYHQAHGGRVADCHRPAAV